MIDKEIKNSPVRNNIGPCAENEPSTQGEKIVVGIGYVAIAFLGATLHFADAYNKSLEKLDVSPAAALREKSREVQTKDNIFFRIPSNP